jgi:5-methylcytosine-specific restriction endonuclease McrA
VSFLLPTIDPLKLKRARELARLAKKKRWWLDKRAAGVCHYCQNRFSPDKLTMDHIVPLARGGTTTPGNVVAACLNCNRQKSVSTPADVIFESFGDEK